MRNLIALTLVIILLTGCSFGKTLEYFLDKETFHQYKGNCFLIADKANERLIVQKCPLRSAIEVVGTVATLGIASPAKFPKDKYDNAIGINSPLQGNINTGLIYDPSSPQQIPQDKVTDFNKTSLDLESPLPLGGPINVSYTTQVGENIVTSPTTQPYTPNSTYSDSFTSPELKARTIDPFK